MGLRNRDGQAQVAEPDPLLNISVNSTALNSDRSNEVVIEFINLTLHRTTKKNRRTTEEEEEETNFGAMTT